MTSLADAGTFYVSVDGKPANDGSREKPWPSVAFALEKVKGGNTLIVLPGVYRGPIEIPDIYAGTEQSPTVIRSEEKWKAVIVGSPMHGIFAGDHCNWTIIDGFEVLGARYDGIKTDSDHSVIRNCWVHHNTQMGVGMHHAKNSTIENNLIEFNGCHIQFDHGIYADGDGLTIRGNIIRHNAAFGMHLYPAIQNSQVYLNLVYGHEHHAGVLLACAKNGLPNQFFQNTVAGNSVALEIWNGTGTVIANNILTTVTGDPLSPLHGTKELAADYNLYWPKSAREERHSLSADPMFLSPHKGIFWLKAESPALGKGAIEHMSNSDFWGRPMPRDKSPDLGAFAFVPWLLNPKSRATWFHDWAYGYQPHELADMPDVWVFPGEAAGSEKIPPK
jgi:hypothetical protein